MKIKRILVATDFSTAGTHAVQEAGAWASRTLRLPADMVVLCLGSESVDALADELQRSVARIFVVGDALGPRKVTEAIAEGALAILDLLGAELDASERDEILSLRPPASPDVARPHALANT